MISWLFCEREGRPKIVKMWHFPPPGFSLSWIWMTHNANSIWLRADTRKRLSIQSPNDFRCKKCQNYRIPGWDYHPNFLFSLPAMSVMASLKAFTEPPTVRMHQTRHAKDQKSEKSFDFPPLRLLPLPCLLTFGLEIGRKFLAEVIGERRWSRSFFHKTFSELGR